MSMLSRSQRTAFKAEQINDAVVLERFPASLNRFLPKGVP